MRSAIHVQSLDILRERLNTSDPIFEGCKQLAARMIWQAAQDIKSGDESARVWLYSEDAGLWLELVDLDDSSLTTEKKDC